MARKPAQQREVQAKELIASLEAAAREGSPNVSLIQKGFERLKELIGKERAFRSVSSTVRLLVEKPKVPPPPRTGRSAEATQQTAHWRHKNRSRRR